LSGEGADLESSSTSLLTDDDVALFVLKIKTRFSSDDILDVTVRVTNDGVLGDLDLLGRLTVDGGLLFVLDGADDGERRFTSELRNLTFEDDLAEASGVAHDGEGEGSLMANLVDPTEDGDFGASGDVTEVLQPGALAVVHHGRVVFNRGEDGDLLGGLLTLLLTFSTGRSSGGRFIFNDGGGNLGSFLFDNSLDVSEVSPAESVNLLELAEEGTSLGLGPASLDGLGVHGLKGLHDFSLHLIFTDNDTNTALLIEFGSEAGISTRVLLTDEADGGVSLLGRLQAAIKNARGDVGTGGLISALGPGGVEHDLLGTVRVGGDLQFGEEGEDVSGTFGGLASEIGGVLVIETNDRFELVNNGGISLNLRRH